MKKLWGVIVFCLFSLLIAFAGCQESKPQLESEESGSIAQPSNSSGGISATSQDITDDFSASSTYDTTTEQSTSTEDVSQVESTASIEISCTTNYGANTDTVTVTDAETVNIIQSFFTGLVKSDMEIYPLLGGGKFLVVTILDGESITSYQLGGDSDKDGVLYCKEASDDYSALTGWLAMPDNDAYDFIISLFEQ